MQWQLQTDGKVHRAKLGLKCIKYIKCDLVKCKMYAKFTFYWNFKILKGGNRKLEHVKPHWHNCLVLSHVDIPSTFSFNRKIQMVTAAEPPNPGMQWLMCLWYFMARKFSVLTPHPTWYIKSIIILVFYRESRVKSFDLRQLFKGVI